VFTLDIQHCSSKSTRVQRAHTGYSTLRFKKYPGTTCSHRVFNIAVQLKVARYSVFTSCTQHCGSKSIRIQLVHTGFSTLLFKKSPGTTCSHPVIKIAVQFQVSRYSFFTPGIQHCGSLSSSQVQFVLTGYSTLQSIFAPVICTECMKYSCFGDVTSSLPHVLLPFLLDGLHVLLHQNISSATYYIPPLFHAIRGCYITLNSVRQHNYFITQGNYTVVVLTYSF